MVDKNAFVLIQEGGSTGELYLHAWDTLEEAEQDRIDCSRDGSYTTSEVVEVPASLANHPDFYNVAEELIRHAVTGLEVVEVPKEEDVDLGPALDAIHNQYVEDSKKPD